ncbi:MAG: AMP-binding protein [Bacteroidales bacterium]|nr:AMP-binding protein [Bacteroidales bacterium]
MFLEDYKKTAFQWKGNTVRYKDLLSNINFFSSLFKARATDKVLIFSENRPEWIYAFYASWINHATPVPVDFMSSLDDVAFIIKDCKPDIIFCSAERYPVLAKAQELAKNNAAVIKFEEIKTEETIISDFEFQPNPDDTAVIIYTSGTTGSPKGVMLTFDNLLANILSVSEKVKIYRPEETVLLMLPLHHVFPLVGSLIAPLFVGATIAFTPSMASEDIISTLQKNKVTIIIGVPRFYAIIRKGIRDKINQSAIAKLLFNIAGKIHSKRFSRKIFNTVHKKFGGNVRYLISGGAALDKDVARDLTTLGFEILEGYGMTEAAPMITFTRPGTYKIGSAGQPLPGTLVKIEDGEILAKGRNIMKGYYNRPGETSDVLKEEWLYTGDLGYLDKDNFLHITGRKKEIIVLSNGKNINPEESEKKLMSISAFIKEVGVFTHNDKLQAVIFPDFQKMRQEGTENIEDYIRWKIIDKYNQIVTPYKRIMKFHLVHEELPKTRLGKIQRFKLYEFSQQFKREQRKHEPEPTFAEYETIRDFLADQAETDIYPTDHLEMDIALDSLGKISLLVFLETTFGVKIPEEKLMDYETVLALAEFVRDHKTRNTFKIEIINWSLILKEKVHLNLPKTWFTNHLVKYISKIFLNILFRLKGEGTANIPEGPCIIAPNHQSFFDGFFIISFLKRKIMNRTYFYAKEKHWRRRWMQFLANRNNVILMDLNKDLKTSIQKMAEVLRKGKNIIIFPEGTRTRDGNLGKFKKTFAILSQELNVPVIPVAINGSYKALPAGAWFPRLFTKVSIKFLQPIYPSTYNYNSLREKVYDTVASHIKR